MSSTSGRNPKQFFRGGRRAFEPAAPRFSPRLCSNGRKRGQVFSPLVRHKNCASLCLFVLVCAGLCQFGCFVPQSRFVLGPTVTRPQIVALCIIIMHKECCTCEWPSPSSVPAWPTMTVAGASSNALSPETTEAIAFAHRQRSHALRKGARMQQTGVLTMKRRQMSFQKLCRFVPVCADLCRFVPQSRFFCGLTEIAHPLFLV